MMIQGEKDERAPVEHSDVMAKVLEEIGHPHEYIVLPNEDHGFYKPKTGFDTNCLALSCRSIYK